MIFQQDEAEEHLIGGLLLRPDLIHDAKAICKSSDFTSEGLGRSFDWFSTAKLKGDGAGHDARAWMSWLAKQKVDLSRTGATHAQVAERVLAMPHAGDVELCAKVLRQNATARRIVNLARHLLERSTEDHDTNLDAGRELVEHAASRIADLQAAQSTGEPKHIREVVLAAMAEIESRMCGKDRLGMTTGFATLDRLLSGMRPGELLILAARPGVGKTALALNITANACDSNGSRVLFVSLEMGQVELCERLLSSVSSVPHGNLRMGQMSPAQRAAVIESSGKLALWDLDVDDRANQRVADIVAAARRKQMRGGLDLVIVDYLQLVHADNPREPRQEQVAKISRSLKQAAKSLGVPVLCLAQLNRQADGNEPPRLSMLRESGSIEQDADVVMFIHREKQAGAEDKREATLIVAKQRNGPTGEVALSWSDKHVTFCERVGQRVDCLPTIVDGFEQDGANDDFCPVY